MPKMKRAILAAALILASSVAFADATSDLLDGEKVRAMSAEEYAAAVRSAPDVNVRGRDGVTPLYLAAEYGTPDNIAALVKAGADVEARIKSLEKPLHAAARGGTPENIAALVKVGADVEARDLNWKTPLHLAAEYGTPENIAALVSAGADVNVRDEDGMTPLHAAAMFGIGICRDGRGYKGQQTLKSTPADCRHLLIADRGRQTAETAKRLKIVP